jgi:hypothetical protein
MAPPVKNEQNQRLGHTLMRKRYPDLEKNLDAILE